MSEPINDGGRAFPCDQIVERDAKGHLHGPEVSSGGMTLRDYFAAKALPAIIHMAYQAGIETRGGAPITEFTLAQQAYAIADAMLKARSA